MATVFLDVCGTRILYVGWGATHARISKLVSHHEIALLRRICGKYTGTCFNRYCRIAFVPTNSGSQFPAADNSQDSVSSQNGLPCAQRLPLRHSICRFHHLEQYRSDSYFRIVTRVGVPRRCVTVYKRIEPRTCENDSRYVNRAGVRRLGTKNCLEPTSVLTPVAFTADSVPDTAFSSFLTSAPCYKFIVVGEFARHTRWLTLKVWLKSHEQLLGTKHQHTFCYITYINGKTSVIPMSMHKNFPA